ncbi:amino acid adenylation domain-containing protein, partial [Nostoc sp. HG1]|nr:amino acid adenylation domain-containing protein [Nostoc sp. HG1]
MLTEVIEGFRLSPQQEHLWTLQQDAQSQIYRTQCAILIEGSLDFEALQVALQTIAQNHEIIRTSFQRLPGMSIPVQVIAKNQNVLIKQYDISECNPHEQAIKIETVFQEISSKITLSQEKFLNTALVTLSTKRHLFLINLPALLADSLTINNFVRELFLAYLGKEISEQAIQYADFAEWQNELLAADETVIGREYWQQQDLSLMFHIKLPGDKNQATIAEFQSEFISAKLAPNVFTQLEKLAQACNISVDVFLLACWQLLVWRLTKQSNIIIGTAFTGRNYPELTNALGLFARYLPVGSHLEDNLNFRQVLEQVNESYSKVAQWQDCFSWQLFEDIQDLTFCPICFDFEEPAIKYSESDVSFSLDQKFSCVDRFNIKLTCKCKDSSVITEFHYDSYQFATADVERLLDQFHTLVASVLTSPDTAISKLEILSYRAKYQLLVEFNQTQTDYPIDTCIHHLYAAQAQLTPDNIAVTFENEQLTYQQLNQRANQLARYLELQGITPNTLVGICVERSLDMIVGILGILKAGAAYVPIDPTYPPERIAWILQNSQAKVLLTQQPLVAKLPPHQAQIICVDTDWKIIAQHSQENLEIATTPNDLAYIIYTSGSTGKPKGVQIAHRNLVHSTNARIAYYQQPVSRFLLLSSFAFDSSVASIFWTLCCGGTLVLPQEGLQREIPQLIELIAQYQISHLLSLPSLYALILEQAKLEKLTSLKTIIVAGEACSGELVKLHLQQLPTSSLFNEYGPTEGTVWSSVYHCQSPDITRVPIGRPIANTQIYILDTQLQPVPTGVPGEVYISGDGLALGYWQQPELTAERFIFNSFNKEAEKRLYKTGDLAQFLPDGNIHFIGRIDQQVKIRGFRIELGEIEFALSQHPEVKEAIAIVREDEPGKQRLVAYILSKSSNTPKDLRQFLQAYLPDYMLPSAFVVLVEFPLSPNGKVDCRALLAPEELSNQRENFVLPRTPVEEILAGIWAEVLGVGRVGIHDNFFELGGHSILATQIVSRIRNTFQVELMLRSLFESPTVAGLGTKIEALLRDNQQLQALPLQAIQRQVEIPLSFAQQRLWFFYQLEPESPAYNIAGAIKVQGSLDVEALNRSINEIVRRHEVLRTQLTAVDGKAIQIILPGLSLPLPIVDVDSETPLNTLIAEEAQRPFDLEREPLLRVRLLRLAAEEHILQFTMHHIVSDGWSAGVLVRELATLYEAFAQNQPSPLPELPIQYADYGLWQREWLQGQLQTQLDYWEQQLGGELPVLALPSDRPRPTVQSFAGDEYAVTLPKELTQELKNLSQKTGVTLFMTLLAAFQTLLYRYSGQEDILVGSPIANRNQSELESLIGFFVNTLVLRTDLSGNPTFQELLGRVREVTLGAYAHQDIPFEKLVEELQPERDLSYAPLFQVMFVLQNAPMQKLELPSLSLETLEVKRGTTNFDLTLSLEELEEGLRFNLEYNTDLFDAETITRLLENFQTLLRGIVSNPQQHLLNLPLLSEAEQQKLQDWSQTPSKHQPVDLCIHRLFEQQVKRTPDKIAVVFEDVTVTYQELNQRANQLAGYLHLLGVGPETLVGLCVERSIEMIVGILGILKAGGAYLPLDPTYPQERLTFMLADAGVSVLVTQHQLLEQLPTFTGSVVCLDENSADIQQQSQDNQNIQITSDNLAYVIYTSGSTGTPKGVLVNHSNVVRLFTATEEWFHFSEKDVWTLFHSSAFDFSVWEIWGALLYGGRLVVVPYSITRSPQDFYNLLCVQQVTVLNQTPSAFRQLIRVVEQCRQTLALRLVIFGGEALDITSLKPWFDHYGDQLPQLVNMYGITETTVHVTYRPLSKADLRLTNSIIGYPIPDLQVYLLNQQRQPVPIGVPGEIYVGGGGVTRGYLQRPELTAERFIPHPVSSSRLYKTGDLARY